MARTLAVPQAHQVFNEFDAHGILMGLPRLELERNVSYKHRLLDVMVHRANSTYLGLIYGITRELGLQLKPSLRITMALNPDGTPVLPSPAVVFQDTKCTLYRDIRIGDVIQEFDRWEIEAGFFTLADLTDAINDVPNFTATLLPGVDGTARSLNLFNQTSVQSVVSEDIATGGPRIQLAHQRLIDGTVSINSTNLVRRVNSETEIRQDGDYYINCFDGMVLSSVAPEPSAAIRYQYSLFETVFATSPVILYNLQSEDFREKMFATLPSGDRGLPTALGADVVNELLSMYPMTWGK
jgi:hypothetical protein